jgi:hypothetical protein
MKPGSQFLLFGRDPQVHVGKVWHMGYGPIPLEPTFGLQWPVAP